jgi:HD-GYP domain-containing protein (c-di-GMP phosphodiesterase class II)
MATSKGQTGACLRLADLLAALSLVTDLGMGQPPDEAMQACLLATGLARLMQLAPADVADVYYTTLLKFVGCTAYAHEEAAMFGDDIAARAAGALVDFANPKEALPFLLCKLGRTSTPLRRAGIIAGTLARGPRGDTELKTAHCEVAASMARRLGMTPAVRQALYQIFERWDGKGAPHRLSGDDIALPARFAQVAGTAMLFERAGGVEAAVEMVRRRSGTSLDPAIAAAFLEHGSALLAAIASADAWAGLIEAEPEPRRWIPESGVDEVAYAFADVVDLKVPFLRGHSAAVAALSERAAHALGLPEVDVTCLHRAGLLHDLGRAGVPNCVWEKPGPLTSSEWERVRLHAYHSERILSRSPQLAHLARIAGMHHERQDGSGYHRQAAGTMVPVGARVLAAADTYEAMLEERPHRPALSPTAAAEGLKAEATAGRLDADAVRAVLAATGHGTAGQRKAWPAGLSDREVEVLRLIARGASYREVARDLCITPKTAGHHIEHIYTKIGVSSRAAAAMFALEHNLIAR